jgi:hypothetical protein
MAGGVIGALGFLVGAPFGHANEWSYASIGIAIALSRAGDAPTSISSPPTAPPVSRGCEKKQVK